MGWHIGDVRQLRVGLDSHMLASAIVALLAFQYPVSAKRVPSAYARGFRTIVADDARMLVSTLAGPDFLGRGPGQPGFDAAAGFAAAWFKTHGLEPAGDNGGYFQRMYLSNASEDPATAVLKPENGEPFMWGKDYAFASTGNIDLKAKLAFVRIDEAKSLTPEERARLRGRIVILDPKTPPRNPVRQSLLEDQSAGTLGAVAVVVPMSGFAVPTAHFTRIDQDPAVVSSMRLSTDAATRLAQAAGATGWLGTAVGVETPDLEVTLAGKAKISDEVASMNVLAKLEGSDPALKREVVVVGSHLDHLGNTPRGVFWGADDDGSGSSANMMIARAFVENGKRPKRTVLFCLWTMEEKGLRGSQFYTAHPAMPLADTIAYLNMDMVGRDSDNPAWTDRAKENTDAVYASSAKIGSPDLYALVTEANRAVGLNLRDDREDRTMRSDTGSFARVGIPVLKAFTGEHPDYHKMTDTSEKLNYPKMAKVAQWVYLCAQELANRKGRPAYVASGRYVQGRVRADKDLELDPQAVVELTLQDGAGKVLDTTRLAHTGHLPQIFTLRYDLTQLDPAMVYTITAKITKGKEKLFTGAPVPVLTKGAPTDGVEVTVIPVR